MGECLMFGLDLESRSLCAVNDEENVRFLIGTHNIKLDNQICLLTVENDYSRISSSSFTHPAGEIRALASSPSNPSVVACVSADYRHPSAKFGVHLYRLDNDKCVLEDLQSHESETLFKGFEWEAQNNRGSVISDGGVEFFDMEGLKKISSHSLDGLVHAQALSPHNNGSTVGFAIGRNILSLDSRTMKDGITIEKAHPHRTLHLDFNPNLQHCVASCGDDGVVRIWDWRNPTKALLSLQPHEHWAWQVRFHPVHDQIILSAGSDACVVLSCVQSVSSEKNESAEEEGGDEDSEDEENNDEGVERLQDGQLERIEEHEESVYACAWSVADPWAFASLSYDGRVVVSRVKRKHKYALLQL